jgi:RNA polymerase sigma factor (sigma-70 family)
MDQQLAILLDNHRRFLDYLTRRVGDRAVAEDILQDAFVRHIGRLAEMPDEAVVPWFYRALRNATVDHFRRQRTASKALTALAREVEHAVAPGDELRREICACVGRLADTLKPEYADALKTVEIDEVPVKDFAGIRGLTSTNAGVRVFRARQALRALVTASCGVCAEHGCVDCNCRDQGSGVRDQRDQG